ncbi:8-oxo-dGTP diphosphatase [Scatolibacter rhodanostii]|uniref:8-oxo-dGTP diphosphatase n=1 Tax=Scatolibacter rhodanostii TaxID=2014781 RepID=UPI000C0748F9|nr:8-oxo-dGTP diphosphatase [Scatolibacter rhodanostii]
MSRSEMVTVTASCMIYQENKILLQDRVKPSWRGLTFPGGHIEKEESFVVGIKREVFEETGLTIHNPRICGIKQFQIENNERYIVVLFKTNEFEGEIVSSDEGEMIWVEREKLHECKVATSFFEMLKICDEENLNEMIYEPLDTANQFEWVLR